MTSPQGPSNKIGIARGLIEIGLERLQSQRRIVQSVSRQMGNDIKTAFTGATSAVNTFDQRLESVNARIRSVQGELTALSASGSALTFFGLRAADNLQNLRIRFRELAGDQERGLALMEEIGDAAARLNLPIRETQNAFSGLIPAIRESGGEVETYINRIARLATVNPREGVAGAVFAVREALSSGGTDLVSLAERFNLPRRRLRELTEETGDFAEALDIVLNEQGATNEALADFSGNLGTATTRIRDAATRALEKAFLPQLDRAVNLLNSASTAIDSLPDGFLEFAGGAVVATTAAAGFALGLSQILSTYANIKKSGVFNAQSNGLFSRSGAGTAGLIAVGGLAAAPGIATGITRGIGRAANDERLSNVTGEDASLVIRQAGAIVGVGIVESGRALTKAIGFIVSQFQTIPQRIDMFKAQFDIVSARMELSFIGFLERLNNLLPGVTLVQNTDTLRNNANAQIEDAQSRIDGARTQIQGVNTILEDSIDAIFDEYIEGNARLFGFAQTEAQEAESQISRSLQQVERETRSLFRNAEERFELIAETMREKLAEIDSAIRFGAELNRLGRDGTVEQVTSRIDGLNDERQAIEALLPELEAIAGTNDDAADALANYQNKLREIDSQINQLAQLTPRLARQALTELGNEFAKEVREIENSRNDALTDLASGLSDDLAELDKDLANKFKDARKEEIEAVSEFQEEREDIEEEHQKRMLEIEQSGRESIFEAAGRLDAAGVRAAIKARDKQREDAEERLGEAREQNNERLQDVRDNLGEERREILDNFNERRNDLIMAAQAERQVIQQRYQEQLNTATQAFNAEAQLLNQYTQQKLRMQSAAQQAEMANKQAGYNAMVQGAQRFAGALSSIARGISTPTKSFGGSMSSSMGTKPSMTTMPTMNTSNIRGSGSFGGSTTSMSSLISNSLSAGKISRFADGGVASFAGNGEALAFIRNKERVLTPQQTSSFDKLISMLSNGGSASGTVPSLDSLNIDVSGVDSFEGLVESVTRQVIGNLYQRQITGV